MPEKKGEMATNGKNNPKKANLLDHNSIKHILDESVSEIVTSKGYVEDVRVSNIRLLIGAAIIIIALFAQFYNKKFPDNKNFLIGCIVLYILFNGILQLIIYTKEKNAILFTYPPPVKGLSFMCEPFKSFSNMTPVLLHTPRGHSSNAIHDFLKRKFGRYLVAICLSGKGGIHGR